MRRLVTFWERGRAAILLLAFLLLPGLRADVEAAEGLAGPIQVVGDAQWVPYYGPNLPQEGALMQIVREAFATQDLEIATTYLPWSRVMAEARKGLFDGVIGMYYTEERAKDFLYSDPILTVRTGLISNASRDIPKRFDRLEDLDAYTFSVLKDNAVSPAFRNAPLRKNKLYSQAAQVRSIFGERGSDIAAASNIDVFLHAARELGLEQADFRIHEPLLAQHEVHLATARALPKAEAIIATFNRGLAELREDERISAILERHNMAGPRS